MLMLSHWVHITNCRLLSIFLPMALFRESVHWSAIITVPENTKESVTYFIRHLHWLPLSCLPDFCSAGLLRECSYRFLHPHRKRLPSEQRLCGSSVLDLFFSCVSVICCGALEGLGAGMPSLCISLLRYLVIILPAALLFTHYQGAIGVWIAFPFTEILTACFAWIIYQQKTRRMFR